MFELGIVLAVTVLALVLFITDLVRVDLVAMLVLAILLVMGILTPAEGLAGFSNDATVTIGAMFVLSEGLRQTGALDHLTLWLGRLFHHHYYRALLTLMIGTAVVSAFINNVAVVAVMLPVVVTLCRNLSISPTRVLIPLSFAAMFGGTCTLIGTSANLLVSSLIDDHGMEPIGMFELTPVGIAFVFVGLIYLITVGQRLLPDRPGAEDLEATYELGEFRADVEVLAGHGDVGERASEFFEPEDNAQILGVLRNGVLLAGSLEELRLESHDVLRISASARMVRRLEETEELELLPLDISPGERPDEQRDRAELFEVVVTPDSSFVGNTLRETGFERHHPAMVIALRRQGEVVVENLMDVRLRGGDILLLEAPRQELRRLRDSGDFIVVSEVGLPNFKEHLLVPVLVILAAVVGIAAMGWMPIVNLAIAAMVTLVVIRAVTVEQAYEAIDWQVIFLLVGFIPLGTALEKTGGIEFITHALVGSLGQYGPLAMLAGFYFTTNFMSDVISNNATAVLMTPLAMTTAISMGADPRPFVMAIAFASSASFASPVGYHTNVMIYSAGNYRYLDFVKVGVPINLLFLVTAVIIIPLVWPL